MIEGGVLRSGDEEIPIWRDGPCWGRFDRFRVSLNGHGIQRFRERIRPDLSFDQSAGELQRLSATALMGYRENKRRDGTWLLLYGPQPAFTMVAWPRLSIRENTGFVVSTWRLITVLDRHDHW